MSGFPTASFPNDLPPAMQYQDLVGWNFDPTAASATFLLNSAARLFLMRIPIVVATTVTNVIVRLVTNGATLANSFVALYESSGILIGQSADQSASWDLAGNEGVLAIPLVGGPYAVSPLALNDFVWAAVYVGSASGLPFFESAAPGGATLLNATVTSARARSGFIAVANTSSLGTILPANISKNGSAMIWVGLN